MDNRHGDFRLPATDKIIGPEARRFRHQLAVGDADGWERPDLDDSAWERVTHGYGPQFWVLGPFSGEAPESELAALARVNPEVPVPISDKPFRWHPYSFSWRLGLEGDPGHQGWHGLKEKITDHFLCLGKTVEGLNEVKYVPEPGGNRYYVWTSITVEQETLARIVSSRRREGYQPHASEVLTPAALYLNGTAIADSEKPVLLKAGPNALLVRYDQAGRGYLVVRREGAENAPAGRTPLAMTWHDDPRVLPFDIHAGARPPEWYRFTAPPGFRGMQVVAKGRVEAWVDGQRMRTAESGRFEAPAPIHRAAVVALRVQPAVGASGGAAFPEPIRLECGVGLAALGDWSGNSALECYSGGAWYRKDVTLTESQAGGSVVLDLGKVVATAEVRVNGAIAGIRVAPPYRVDIGSQVKAGPNRIEILVFNTLANHYLTIPTRYRGELTSGLLGPVSLQVTPRSP
jgi:hypothetical protein